MENDLLILQMRSYDRKRLIRKIGMVTEPDFREVLEYIRKVI